jgi:hypothetical protein
MSEKDSVVTPEMIEAGLSVLAELAPVSWHRFLGNDPASTICDVYEEMNKAKRP